MVRAQRTVGRQIRSSLSDRVFYAVTLVLTCLFTLAVCYPLVYVLSASFSEGRMVSAGKVVFWPVHPTLEGYRAVFRYRDVLPAYGNTLLYTVLGTCVNLLMVIVCAYPMYRRDLPGKNGFMAIFVFTMYFSGGMIPHYMLIRDLGMIDTLWAMVIPGALSVYHMIITRTYLQSTIPQEMLDAAQIDGCSDMGFFVRMVLPLSKAIIAVIAVYAMVGHWNSYFGAMLYLNSRARMPLQIVLREILIANQYDPSMLMDPELQAARAELADVLKYAFIVIATVPILCVYPFAQKHFVKGVMVGSIKA